MSPTLFSKKNNIDFQGSLVRSSFRRRVLACTIKLSPQPLACTGKLVQAFTTGNGTWGGGWSWRRWMVAVVCGGHGGAAAVSFAGGICGGGNGGGCLGCMVMGACGARWLGVDGGVGGSE